MGAGTNAPAATAAASASSAPPATTAPPNSTRPEGPWILTRWEVSRSDGKLERAGLATEAYITYVPSCPSGPCDLKATPGGADGTFQRKGMPTREGQKPTTDPYDVVWHPNESTYTYETAETKYPCTAAGGTVVEDGYTSSTTTTLTFTPASGKTPASLTGTRIEHNVGNPAGAAAGCTSYDDTWQVAAAPLTAFDPAADISGTFVITEVVDVREPADPQRPRGFIGVFPKPVTISKSGDAFTLESVDAGPVPLTSGASGWSGTSKTVTADCTGTGGTVSGGSTITESWNDLLVESRTKSGAPVLGGRWEQKATLTAAGTSGGCSAGTARGYVIMVPEAATTP